MIQQFLKSKNRKKSNRGGKKSPQKKSDDKKDILQTTIFNNLYYPSNRVHCDACEKDISKQVKIYCPGSQSDICMNCFADGVEFNNHKIDEDYHVINKLNYPLLADDWTCEEELLLFEGLERFGFGNWQDIADHIGTDKTKEEVEKHYEESHLDASTKSFYPQEKAQFLTKRDEKTLELHITKSGKNSNQMQEEKAGRKKSARSLEKNAQPPGIQQSSISTSNARALTTPNQGNLQTNQQNTANHAQNGNAQDIVGYMPLRGDFDIEYDNDAELLLAEMEFNDDDKETELKMKYKLLEIYNARLDERIKRKKFVIERGLLDLKKQNNLDKERTKEEKEIYNMMKVFSRFSKPEEHERLVQGIIKEKQIRQRIEELKTYRKLGLKTFEDVENYLNQKRKNDENFNKRQKSNEKMLQEKSSAASSQGNRQTSRRTRSLNMFVENKDHVTDKKKQLPPNVTEQEIELCDKLNISPYEYLVMKEVLVRQAIQEGFIKIEYAQHKLKLDKDRVTGIFDFLVAHKYILEKK
ncbi:hypothetical protein ABPG72_012229 [Tetrahymena utriculariae]